MRTVILDISTFTLDKNYVIVDDKSQNTIVELGTFRLENGNLSDEIIRRFQDSGVTHFNYSKEENPNIYKKLVEYGLKEIK